MSSAGYTCIIKSRMCVSSTIYLHLIDCYIGSILYISDCGQHSLLSAFDSVDRWNEAHCMAYYQRLQMFYLERTRVNSIIKTFNWRCLYHHQLIELSRQLHHTNSWLSWGRVLSSSKSLTFPQHTYPSILHFFYWKCCLSASVTRLYLKSITGSYSFYHGLYPSLQLLFLSWSTPLLAHFRVCNTCDGLTAMFLSLLNDVHD